MSNLAYLGLAVGLSVVGLLVLWLLRRRPRSLEAGMEAFSRELQALAPPDARASRREAHIDQVTPAPIRPRPTPATRREGRFRGGQREGRGAPQDETAAATRHDDPPSAGE